MIELNWLLLDEIERTRAQLVRLRTALTTRREESTSRMDQCKQCQRLGTPTRQPRLRLFSLAWKSSSTTENQGPQKFEARARTRAAELGRVKARQRLAEDQAATGPSVRVCVLFGPAKVAQLRGVFGLAFPPGFPMAAHSLSYGSSAAPIDLRPRPDFGLLLQSLKSLRAPLNQVRSVRSIARIS